jgi:TolB-like protein
MHKDKISASDSKEYPPDSLMGKLKERKIIATLAAFVGSGVVIIEVAHHILVNHYHLPHQIVDICIVTLAGALIATSVWRWFSGAEKRPGNVKVEVLVVPLVALLTFVIDLKFIFVMTGVSINMLVVGIIALCLGIGWVVFKSLQWAAGAPEAEKKAVILKPLEGKPISFPEWNKSIVVLPFDNISPEEGQDYFCDGMTEEIITDLSHIHDLRVISRSSAMTLKGSKKSVRDIAKELDVQYVLEGSVRKAGNDIRITAQLIDATTDAHLWAEKYSGTLDNIFEIQEKVSCSIVDALKVKLEPHEKREMAEHPIENIHAYESYLRAKKEFWSFSEDSLDRALQEIKRAIGLIGENELLLATEGAIYVQYILSGVKREEFLEKLEECIKRIYRLNPNSVQGNYLQGIFQIRQGQIQEALVNLRRVLSVNPGNPDALFWFIYIHCMAGRTTSAKPLTQKLLGIDPFTPLNYMMPGYIAEVEGRFEDSIEYKYKALEMEPGNPFLRYCYIQPLLYSGRLEEAFRMIDRIVKDTPHVSWAGLCLLYKHALKDEKEEALYVISAEQEEMLKSDEAFSYQLAEGYALINEKKKALDWLENAVDRGFINYPFLDEVDPFFENIRGDERFKKLMERVKHAWENFEV